MCRFKLPTRGNTCSNDCGDMKVGSQCGGIHQWSSAITGNTWSAATLHSGKAVQLLCDLLGAKMQNIKQIVPLKAANLYFINNDFSSYSPTVHRRPTFRRSSQYWSAPEYRA